MVRLSPSITAPKNSSSPPSRGGWTLETECASSGWEKGLTGHVGLTGKPYLGGDTRIDPNYMRFLTMSRCELVVPSSLGRVWGLINLDGLEPDAFDDWTLSTRAACGTGLLRHQAAA